MEASQYKCPSCGAELTFNPTTQGFTCEWCRTEHSAADILKNAKYNEQPEDVTKDYSSETDVYVCSSCGANIIAAHDTAATFCYYCHNPVALKGRIGGEFRPERIIPFKINKADAHKLFIEHFGSKWFVPSNFLSKSTLEKMVGLYVPYWLCDCDVDAHISGEAQIIRTWVAGRYSYTNTKVYAVSRAGNIHFDMVPADGSERIEDDLIDAIEPYDYNQLVPFSMAYLSGFFADKYDVNKDKVYPRIEKRVTESSEEILKADITGYNNINIKNRAIKLNNVKWHYVLMPVWFMTYKNGEKTFFYALNGQTGKVSGKYPLSVGKLLLSAILVFIVALILVAVLFLFIMW